MGTKNFMQVLMHIKHLLGMYYQLRLAGGTNPSEECDEEKTTTPKGGDKNITVAPIMIDSYKNLFMAIVPYELNANIQKDDEKKHEWKDESFEDLAVRKLREEVGYMADKSDLVFVYERRVRDNRYKDKYVPHTKRLYLVVKIKGKLIDRNNGSLLKNETHSPFWVPARILPDFLFEGHLEFFEKLIDFLYKGHRINKKDYFSMKESIMIRKIFGFTKNKVNKVKKYITVGTH